MTDRKRSRAELRAQRRIPIRPRRRLLLAALGLAALFIGTLAALDHGFPPSLPRGGADFAVTVVAGDGTPLRSFPDRRGVWRYPVSAGDVSPRYLAALIHYEDRYFRYHPGVNPWALGRALFQYIRHGTPKTGGSTLTMQVARLFHPHSRTIGGKLHQILRALQLEWRLSKSEILTLYLNYAPFGGPIEGVQAASYAYLGKPAKTLSHAEAALLAVLPQSPTRLRPDRHPQRAERARNKVLDRLARFGVWGPRTVADAKMERVRARFERHPMRAPLLCRRLRPLGQPGAPVRTTIDNHLQAAAADRISAFIADTPEQTSAAALVVENERLAVRAYVGSADLFDADRFGHVDMVRAHRSPGSTLKPFLYGLAIEEGLIHSESLLVDAPFDFSGYRPGNFTRSFSGPVGAAEALRRSLNIPAVDLLDRLGPRLFDARLRHGGLRLRYPSHGGPNLSMILGGVGTSLEDLVAAYAALARKGLSGSLRFTVDAPLRQRRMMSEGAAFIVRRILMDHRRPDLPGGAVDLAASRRVAWKTGTSYGFRDAWTLGVTDRYTVGVWVGRPDGTPSPGQYGRATAAPLLFALVDSLPRRHGPPPTPPESVERIRICWPLGTPPADESDPLCHERRQAWILKGMVPPTLPDRMDRHWQPNPLPVPVDPATGRRVAADCPVPRTVIKAVARWPKAARPWLDPRLRRLSRVPPIDPRCGRPVSTSAETIRIMGISPETVLRPAGAETRLPSLALQAQGGRGGLFWFLNGDLVARTGVEESRIHQFTRPGRYRLSVMDLAGNHDAVEITVLGAGIRGSIRADTG